MDKSEKRRLKKLGKKLAAEESAAMRRALDEANPAERGTAAWDANYQAGIAREKELRAAQPTRMTEQEALHWFVLHPDSHELPAVPMHHLYVQCARCRDLLHLAPAERVSCQCNALTLWMERGGKLKSKVAGDALLRVVRLIGRGNPTPLKWKSRAPSLIGYNSPARSKEVLAHLDAIEAEMKRIGFWTENPPDLQAGVAAGTIRSHLDTPSFELWLQCVFLPNARSRAIEGALPSHSNVGLIGLRQYDYMSIVPEALPLLSLLHEFDDLILRPLPPEP